MIDETNLRALARRVAGAVMSERGRVEHPHAHPSAGAVERTHAVHVTVEAPRPAPSASRDGPSQAPSLLTGDGLRGVPDGGRLVVARGARITALARDEAWRRGIAIVEGAAPADARREDGARRIAIAADHGGVRLKGELRAWLLEQRHVVVDLGTHDENAVDYPDYARAVAEAVADGRADVGICIDGAGIGSAMAANKVPGARAANCWDEPSARNAREHNFANVLTLGGRTLAAAAARRIVEAFLGTAWGEARHARRIEKIAAIERAWSRSPAGGERR